jgi:hypothetical protein
MPQIAYGRACSVIVLVQGNTAPSDAEWEAYLSDAAVWVAEGGLRGLLVHTAGGAPTPAQRHLMDTRLSGRVGNMKVAVLTSSTFARGVLRAISAFYSQYRGFEPGALRDALGYLGVSSHEFDAVERCLQGCQLQLHVQAGR